MKKLVFTGREDSRVLGAADFAKVGVELKFDSLTFHQGQPVEIHNDAAAALLDNPGLFGEFEEYVEEKPKKAATKTEPPSTQPTDQVS